MKGAGAIVGVLCGLVCLASAVSLTGAPARALFDIPSLLIVLGGVLAALCAAFPLPRVLAMPAIIRRALLLGAPDASKAVRTLVELAGAARRDGVLSLESRLANLDDPFLALGVQMVIDGLPAAMIEEVLRAEMETQAAKGKEDRALLDHAGRSAPAFGLIGTLLGLISMLGDLSDPGSLAPAMAVAMVTTLYGAVLANLVFLPIGEKIGRATRAQVQAREAVLRGVLALQAGDAPRILQQRLNSAISEVKLMRAA